MIVPRLPFAERPVPGPPKRFAQGMGLAFSLTATLLAFVFDAAAAWVVTGLLAAAAFLEAAFGLCLGCRVFALLIARGSSPRGACDACADILVARRSRHELTRG